MGEEMKETNPTWVPQTPTKLPSETEINNNGVSDTKEEVGGSSRTPRKKRPKTKKHRPKVVNESKPLKPVTPKPRTPKPVKRKSEKNVLPVKRKAAKRKLEKEDDDSEDGRGCRKLVCRRELKFDEESCDENNGVVKKKRTAQQGGRTKLVCRRELKFDEERGDKKNGIVKKRSARQRMSILKLIRLVGMIHDKCKFESRLLNLTCINSKRRRSRLPTRCRKDLSVFLPIGPQVQLVDDQCEQQQGDVFSPQENGNGNVPQVELVDDQCEHQSGAFSPHGNVETCSTDKEIIQGDALSPHENGNVETCSTELDIVQVSDDAFKEAMVDYATQKMEALHLVDQMSGALQVVDRKDGAIQSVNQTLQIVNPKHRRAKVVLDEETLRVWKLLMTKEEGEEATDTDNVNEHLAKERELFTTLIKAFNAMMSGLTGNRQFSRWKGSVVDSVVGVFLTQNVGDNLSSNAFMSLAAKYPPKSIRELNGCIDRVDYAVSESQEVEMNELAKREESDSNNRVKVHVEKENKSPRKGKEKVKKNEQENPINWDELRKLYSSDAKRGDEYADFVDWEAVRRASEEEIAKVIEERGMSNQLARRIKNFLDRLVRDHGSMDLEWLRNTPPDKVKEYLLSIDGLGLKSTECVRLLSLVQRAFPVDVNAARVLVRLGWVQLEPLPDGLLMHLLNDYPELGSVQKFMWPRLSHIDELTLYEYHCCLNIFSKSFCTKTRPNCNACPMRGDCKHYASALASSRLHLEDSRDKNMSSERNQEATTNGSRDSDGDDFRNEYNSSVTEPIIEFPPSPSPEPIIESPPSLSPESIIEFPPSPGPASTELLAGDIEDFGMQIPTIIIEELSNNLSNVVKDDVSKAVVALDPRGGSIPMPKLKYVERLRTLLLVYVLPDSHPLLAGFEKREPEDPCPYLLAICDQESPEELQKACKCMDGPGSTTCCATCCSSEIVEHNQNNNVKGTILIPCRTANRGGFPLNGTYFQINEVFADHESSRKPIDVPRALIWNLDRRILYCGTSITSICRGMSLDQVICCFRKGYICIRGFDLKTRSPKPLAPRFHFCKTRQSNVQ